MVCSWFSSAVNFEWSLSIIFRMFLQVCPALLTITPHFFSVSFKYSWNWWYLTSNPWIFRFITSFQVDSTWFMRPISSKYSPGSWLNVFQLMSACEFANSARHGLAVINLQGEGLRYRSANSYTANIIFSFLFLFCSLTLVAARQSRGSLPFVRILIIIFFLYYVLRRVSRFFSFPYALLGVSSFAVVEGVSSSAHGGRAASSPLFPWGGGGRASCPSGASLHPRAPSNYCGAWHGALFQSSVAFALGPEGRGPYSSPSNGWGKYYHWPASGAV